MSEKPYLSQMVFWAVAVILIVGILWLFSPILLPFVIGAILAYFLNPVVAKLQRRGLKRWMAVLLILSTFTLFMVAIIAISTPLIARQVSEFIDNVPQYSDRVLEKAKPYLDWTERKTGYDIVEEVQTGIDQNIGKTLQMSQKVFGGLALGILAGGRALIEFVSVMLLIPIVAYFMMKDWPRITATVDNIFPRESRPVLHDMLQKIDAKLSGFLRGQILVCFILGGMYAVSLTLAGLHYGFLIGIITGILSVIPYVGSTIGLLTSLGVAALQTGGDMGYIGIIAIIFFTGQFIEGNFVAPRLIGDSVGLHPLWIIFALLAGASLMGLLGMIIAVPVAAVASVLLAFAIQQYKSSAYYKRAEPVLEPSVIIDPSAPEQITVLMPNAE